MLRVPEELHRRLMARAAREGCSLNAFATGVLAAAADADGADRSTRLRATAAAQGLLHHVEAAPISPERRDEVLNSFRGIGEQVDRLLDEDRGRL